MNKILLFGLAFAFCLVGNGLEIGDKAPELQVSKWVKGSRVKISDGLDKNVYVVEIWATWCPTCKITIPHLSELQKRYADKGLVVVGVSSEDEKTVGNFAAKQADMNYNVAVDDARKTSDAYMGKGAGGIPCSFVVGKDGTVLWKGHPMDLDRVLQKIFNNEFDMSKQKKIGVLHDKLQQSLQTEKFDDIIKLCEQTLDLDPGDDLAIRTRLYVFENQNQMEGALPFFDELQKKAPKNENLYLMKLDMMNQLDVPAEEKLRECRKIIDAFADNPEVLNSLAWMVMDRMRFGTWSVKVAYDAAKKAVELAPQDIKPVKKAYYLTSLARACYSSGKIADAVARQEEAVRLVKGEPEEKGMAELLNFYKEAEMLQGQGGKPAEKTDADKNDPR